MISAFSASPRQPTVFVRLPCFDRVFIVLLEVLVHHLLATIECESSSLSPHHPSTFNFESFSTSFSEIQFPACFHNIPYLFYFFRYNEISNYYCSYLPRASLVRGICSTVVDKVCILSRPNPRIGFLVE
jgi:hypothetical protein